MASSSPTASSSARPCDRSEGQDYLAAMAAAANFAWANRQALTHQARKAFAEALAGKVQGYELRMVYDIAHNMAKLETHDIDGADLRVCVHRKGATQGLRAWQPGVPRRLSGSWPAGAGAGQHGHGQLRPGRH